MFCPNCGGENQGQQNYCPACGLKLDAISHAFAGQRPSIEFAKLQRRKELFEKLGLLSMSVSALIGVGLLFAKAAYYKLLLFGPEVLFWSALGALVLFGLLSVFFFNYPKVMMKFDKARPSLAPPAEEPTAFREKLIEDRPFQPVSSVTENTTDLLPRRNVK
jgi:hypothetical protein